MFPTNHELLKNSFCTYTRLDLQGMFYESWDIQLYYNNNMIFEGIILD